MQHSKPQEDPPSTSKIGVLVERDKGKAIIDVEWLEENNIKTQPRRRKTREMARKEQNLEDPSPPQYQDTIAVAQAQDTIFISISAHIEKKMEY